jgi:predicted CoA-binding protein
VTNDRIESFLRQPAIAVVGVSRTRGFGNSALRALRAKGYRAFPVNAAAEEIGGERCWRSLAELPEPVGAALVVVPPARATEVVADCARQGIRHVWLQQGSESDEAIRAGEEAGLALVHHACVLMYARPRGIHRLHRWIHERRARRPLGPASSGSDRA